MRDAITEAYYYCVDNGILKEYLESKKNEVIEMMEREFDYDREIRERIEEAREEGMKKE